MLHEDELPVDVDLVGRLVASQFPEWADEPLRPFDSVGSTNWIFRLGDDRYVRLPRRPFDPDTIRSEQTWLGRLGTELTTPIPRVLGCGEPGEGYPMPWTVLDWLPGEPATNGPVEPLDVVRFLRELRAVDPTGGPPPSPEHNWRGGPLARRDPSMRRSLARCDGLLDVAAVTAVWERAVAAPAWDGPPTFVHGDLMAGNVLVAEGRLAGVVDFGSVAVGDPATDLIAAWALFEPAGRATFRRALDVDDDTWARGVGWGLSVATIALPYYLHTSPAMTSQNRAIIEQVMIEA